MTKTERDSAIVQVVAHLLSGQRKEHITEWITKTWPDADAIDILTGAEEHFEDISHFSADAKKGFCVEAAQHLYAQLVSSGDYKGALNALQEIAKLAGAYPERSATTRKGENLDNQKSKPGPASWPPKWIEKTG